MDELVFLTIHCISVLIITLNVSDCETIKDWWCEHQGYGCHAESHAKVYISEHILVSLMYVFLDLLLLLIVAQHSEIATYIRG